MRILYILIASVLTTGLPVTTRADMVNRWSFNGAPGNAPSGTTFTDPIAGTAATVRGGGATTSASALTLPGSTTGNQTAANIAAYLDLPDGIISSKPNLTVEAWITPVSSKTWQRLFDFGRANVTVGPAASTGEIIDTTTLPGAYTAWDNLSLSLNNSTSMGNHRAEGRLANGTRISGDANLSASTTAGTEYHYVLTVTDGAGTFASSGCQAAFYRNGVLQRTVDLGFRLTQISDVNNWIGRSQYGTESCSNIAINELRIYNHAMSGSEVLASYSAGPNPAFALPVAVGDTLTMHRGQKARIAVLANDTGALSAPTVTVIQAPQFGTAVPDGTGKILYTHTTGTPASDSFTYRVSGPGGTSSPATVTITFSNSLRIANSTLNVPSTPPALATRLDLAFSGLSSPVCLASPPGDALRLFVCQKGGLLRVIQNITAASPVISTFLDLPALLTSRGEAISAASEQGLLGLAFHPNYATNRYFYVFYSVAKGPLIYERVSRFTAEAGNPNVANSASELVIIEQLDEAGNNNGGSLHFGPDGYLYVSVGDEGNQNDSLSNSQRIDKDFFSGILRIDVDKKPGSVAPTAHASIPRDAGVARYTIPSDNPFVGATTFNGAAINTAALRAEFWAVGMRHPWRFSFDSQTGELWAGDAGSATYEEVNVVAKGGNYGWAYREGNHNGPKSGAAPANFDTLFHKPPLYEYVHTGVPGGDANFKGNAVIGGLVYRGTRFPGLTGSYIFGDYVSGNIWSLVRNGANPPTVTRIAGEVGVVAFGTDPSNGDVLLADYDGGRILRLTVGAAAGSFPETLSATGLFADLTDLSPAPGLLPYSPNLSFWSDYAIKSRWFIIPDATSKMTWSRDGVWTFPAGQIWVKHFDLETTRGNPATKKRIETRLLVKNTTGVYGVSYQWNDAGTEATLVPDGGADFDLMITTGGSLTTQRWSIPSRSDCLKCHTPQAGLGLSFSTRQINVEKTINGFTGNQIALLASAGYFSNVPESPAVLPRHYTPDETGVPLETRARSYLAVNCSNCHRAGGTAAPAAWDGRPELTLAQTGLINGVPSNDGGNALNKLIVPGDLQHSVVLSRISVTNGFTRMPPLATSELDQTNITLITDWIASLPINADLASLVPSVGTLAPVFASGTTNYTASVSAATTSMTVTPTVAQTGATVRVNGVPVVSGTASGPITLGTGTTTITIVVTALNGTTAKTYRLAVTRASQPSVQFTSSSSSMAESVATRTITMQLSAVSASAVTVPFTVTGTAANPADYTVSTSPLAIPAGQTSANITVTVVNDASVEPNESVIVTMGTPTNATSGATTVHTATILDNDAPPTPTVQFTSATSSAAESVTARTITAQLSATSTLAVTVPFTVTGTASNPADYTRSSSPLTIPAGQTSASITLTVVNDALVEPNETVIVAMGAPTNATLGATTVHTATILDNDSTGSNNADLISLMPSVGTLTPAFMSTTLNYNATVNNSTLSIRLTPVVSAPGATVTVNGVAVASGTASSAIPLVPPSTVINTVVSAPDGVTRKTYRLTVSVTVNPAVAGYFTGLATPTAASTNPARQVGLSNMSVIATGAFSGKVLLGGSPTALVISGTFVGGTVTLPLARAGLPTLSMTLNLAGDVITGTLTEGTTVVSTLALTKFLYTSTVPPPPPLLNVPLSILNPATDNGAYTAALTALTPVQQGLAASAYPQGNGWITLKVSSSGFVSVSGKNGDGKVFSYMNYLPKDNVFPFYVPVYSAAVSGTVSGLIRFRNVAGQSDVDGTGFRWFKPANAADTAYRNGWPTGIRVNLTGSKFIAPTLANVPTASLGLRDGNLASPTLNHFAVNAASVVTVLDPAIGAQNLAVTLATNGSFTGSFLHPVSNTSTTFEGVILQKTQNGSGYFLGAPATGSPLQSGAVIISVP